MGSDEAFDEANNSLGVIDNPTLLPSATYFVLTANMRGVIPVNAASLRVTSDQPISGYQAVGVVNGKGLSAALGILGEDPTVGGLEMKGSTDGSVLSAYPRVRRGEERVKSTAGSLGSGEWRETHQAGTEVERLKGKSVSEAQTLSSRSQLSTDQKPINSSQTLSTSGPVAGLSLIWPVKVNEKNEGVLGQDYAQYDYGRANEHHTGLDISGVKGKTTVRAAADGWVVKIQENDVGCKPKILGNCEGHGFGNTVIIKHQIGSTEVYTQYSHLHSFADWLNSEEVKKACPLAEKKKRRRICTKPVPVEAGKPLGKVGCTGYGNSGCSKDNPPHLHFELKNFDTLAPGGDDPGGTEYGYTAPHPDKKGYHDPILNLHQVSSIAEIRVRVTAAGEGINIRVGPGDYRALRTVKKGEEFIAFRTSPPTASPACSGGWYQIRPTDKSNETRKVNNELYFQDPSRRRSKSKFPSAIPDAWICRGNAGQV